MSSADLWEREAAGYDRAYDDPGGRGRLVRARLETALAFLPVEHGEVLDVGMGGGRLVEALDARGWQVTGTDASETMVELARSRVPSRAGAISRSPIEQLPFADASFDAVVALGVLEYSADVGEALGELARVLRPGGTAVVSFPAFDALPSRLRRPLRRMLGRGTARHVLAETDLRRLLAAAGLEIEDTCRLGSRGRPARRLLAAQLVFAARKRPAA